MSFHVYILTNRPRGTLYIGVTNNLARRVHEHREKEQPGFSEKYNLIRLVFYEEYLTADEAIRREKAMKKWNRA
jgi:putative endonuclease